MNQHPIHVQRKREMYDGERVDDDDESSCFSENEEINEDGQNALTHQFSNQDTFDPNHMP